eukprot:tig00020710_g13356.t1
MSKRRTAAATKTDESGAPAPAAKAKRSAESKQAPKADKQTSMHSFVRVRRPRAADGAKHEPASCPPAHPSKAVAQTSSSSSGAASAKRKAECAYGDELFDTAAKRARGVVVKERGVPPPKYKVITKNFYTVPAPAPLPKDEIPDCECRPGDGRPGACGEACENRGMLQECVKGHCRHGDACTNQRFQRCQYAKVRPPAGRSLTHSRTPCLQVEVFHTRERGWGARAAEAIPAGGFVVEYAGEIIDEEEMARRAEESEEGAAYYFMRLNGPYIIDAGPRATYARFLNHSCDPNCVTRKARPPRPAPPPRPAAPPRPAPPRPAPPRPAPPPRPAAPPRPAPPRPAPPRPAPPLPARPASQGWLCSQWTVGSEERVGIFALRDIAPGEELTYDYQVTITIRMEPRIGAVTDDRKPIIEPKRRKGANRGPTYDYQTDPLPGMVRQKCLCGSARCRGFLNSNATSAK